MRVLVTGATGFLGSHLVKALLRERHEVVILKRSFSDCFRIADVSGQLHGYDLDTLSIEDVFREQGKVDAVIHTATCYGRKGESFHEIQEANVAMPLQLLECSIRSGTTLFLNTDTFSNTGDCLSRRMLGYHLTKRHFCEWGVHLAKRHSLRFLNLKLEHLYGPADSPEKFVPSMVHSCLHNVPDLYLTAGAQKRDFIHVQDAVSAYLLLLRHAVSLPEGMSEYQVGSGVATSIRELVELVHELTGAKTRLHFGALPYPPDEIMFSQADVEPLRKWGWYSRIGLREGLLSVIRGVSEGESRS